jgi:hypothetical protein
MSMISKIIGLSCALNVLSATSGAADSLGFRFADLSVGAVGSDASVAARAHATADFAITDSHGLQLDLSATGYGSEFLGQIDGHLYMMPTPNAKYGLFASLADMDGREATIGQIGVEAMFALSARTELHGRAGIGMANPGNIDFIAISLGASHALSDQVGLFADLTIAEFDEAALRAVGSVARFGASYQPDGRPWEVTASLVRDGLTGRDAAAFETRVVLDFTLHLGAGGGAKRGLATRGFDTPQPFDPLLRRGMF